MPEAALPAAVAESSQLSREDVSGSRNSEILQAGARSVKMLVYSHDTFGLGNIRRMISICEYVQTQMEGMSILVLTGSPMLHSFRLTQGIDYVKLPCLRRDMEGDIQVRYLNLTLDSIVRLRRELILTTVTHFRPDILLVDKKPGGVGGELEASLKAVRAALPNCSIALLLRDILDEAAVTIEQWKRQSAYQLLEKYYDRILVTGLAELYDVREEYQLPRSLREKVHFCGYVRRHPGGQRREALRRELEIQEGQRLILVTAGGGEDGYGLIRNYVSGIALDPDPCLRTLVVTGPELAVERRREIKAAAGQDARLRVIEFTDQMMDYMNAADVVVSMAGYNTICEILSLRKRAVVVPRVVPVQEQKIRAERMARLGLFQMMDPANLTPKTLMDAVRREVKAARTNPYAPASLELDALPRISSVIRELAGRGGGRKESRAQEFLRPQRALRRTA